MQSLHYNIKVISAILVIAVVTLNAMYVNYVMMDAKAVMLNVMIIAAIAVTMIVVIIISLQKLEKKNNNLLKI